MVDFFLFGLESGVGFGVMELFDVEYLNVVFELVKVLYKFVIEIRFFLGWEINYCDDDFGFGIVRFFNYIKISILLYFKIKYLLIVLILDMDGVCDGVLEFCLIIFVVLFSVFSLIIC